MAAEENIEDLPRLIIDDSKKMKPPNKKKFDEEMETFQSQIKEKEIKYEKLKSNTSEVKSIEAERRQIIDRRKRIATELEKLNKDIPEKMRRLNELKSSLVYKSEDKINNAISRLEWNMNAKTFKLTEEKKIVSEIDRLKRSKKTLVQYQALEQEINGIRDRQRGMREARDAFSRTISQLRAKEDVLRQDYQKTKVLKQEIDNLYEQKRQLFASFKRQKEEFKDVKDKQRRESMKKKEEERRAIQVKRKQRVEMELDKLPHEGELHLCQTLITYLSRFGLPMQDTVHEGLSPASSQAEDPEPAEEMDDGQFVLLKKTDDSEDLDFSIGLNRSRRKNRRSRKQSMIKKITHSTDVLSQFVTLNLNAPSSLLEVGDVIDELKQKKAFYEGEQQKVESTSDTGFSLTESMMCEMSRQASKTESCEGGSQENACPDESIYTDLLKASMDEDVAYLRSSAEELLGAVGGVVDSECSDSATPKSDSQNSDSTVEGEGGSNEAQAPDIGGASKSSDNEIFKQTLKQRRSLSPKFGASKPAPWLSISPASSPRSESSPNYLTVPGPSSLTMSSNYPSLPSHQPLQKTQSLQPHSPLTNSDVKSYAHSVKGRSQSFSHTKKPLTISPAVTQQQSHQHSPPSSLPLSTPLSSSLNLPSSTKRPVRRSKTMTPTGSSQWRDKAAAWGAEGEDFRRTKGREAHKPVSPSVSLPLRSPLSPRFSFPLPSPNTSSPTWQATASSTAPTAILDQDFPPLSQAATSLRRSSNLSSKSSNGSLSRLDQPQTLIKSSPCTPLSTSNNIPQPPPSTAPWQSLVSPSGHSAPTDRDGAASSSVNRIPDKDKSATELWVESSIAFVQDEVTESAASPSAREATKL